MTLYIVKTSAEKFDLIHGVATCETGMLEILRKTQESDPDLLVPGYEHLSVEVIESDIYLAEGA